MGVASLQIGLPRTMFHGFKLLLGNLAVLGLIEFFLRERSEKKTQAFHLNRRDNAVHDFIEISDGEQLTARHVSEFGTRGEENRRRKLRRDVLRKVEVDVEAPQIAPFLAADFINLPIREDLAAGGVLDMRQRQEPRRQQTLLPDFVGRHRRQSVPGHACRELDADALPVPACARRSS